MKRITQQRLKELLDYNKDTGKFLWQQTLSNGVQAGSYAGCVGSRGYRYIRIDGVSYFAHRLAWLYTYGEFPGNQIDHINGDRDDNRLSNLRDVVQRTNQQNRYTHRNGRLVGCNYHKSQGKWRARIRVGGKSQFLGYYDTEQEGHEAYMRALDGLV